jgi:DNA-binding CsgD family transcriptional regulator
VKDTLLDLIELAYTFAIGNSQWCKELAARAAEYNPYANASMLYLFRRNDSDTNLSLLCMTTTGLPRSYEEHWISEDHTTNSDGPAWFYRKGIRTATVSEIGTSHEPARAAARWLARLCSETFPDWFFLVASTGSSGVVLLAPMTEVLPLDARTRWASSQLGIHLRNASQLRQLSDFGSAVQQAIDGPAPGASATELSARSLWEGLLSGKWSFVQKVDDSRVQRYVVYPNPLGEPAPRALTERESTVIELVASGHTNSTVSRMLGISSSTVASQLSQAMRKLGIETRRELIWVHRLLSGT